MEELKRMTVQGLIIRGMQRKSKGEHEFNGMEWKLMSATALNNSF